MENKMGNERETLGPLKGVHRDITTPLMENKMGKNMEHETEVFGYRERYLGFGISWRLGLIRFG